MNVTFPVMNTSYRPTISTPGRRPARSERTKGDYDTVNIRSSRTIQEDDESFARLLARFLQEFGCNESRYDPYQDGPVPKFREGSAAWF